MSRGEVERLRGKLQILFVADQSVRMLLSLQGA